MSKVSPAANMKAIKQVEQAEQHMKSKSGYSCNNIAHAIETHTHDLMEVRASSSHYLPESNLCTNKNQLRTAINNLLLSQSNNDNCISSSHKHETLTPLKSNELEEQNSSEYEKENGLSKTVTSSSDRQGIVNKKVEVNNIQTPIESRNNTANIKRTPQSSKVVVNVHNYNQMEKVAEHVPLSRSNKNKEIHANQLHNCRVVCPNNAKLNEESQTHGERVEDKMHSDVENKLVDSEDNKIHTENMTTGVTSSSKLYPSSLDINNELHNTHTQLLKADKETISVRHANASNINKKFCNSQEHLFDLADDAKLKTNNETEQLVDKEKCLNKPAVNTQVKDSMNVSSAEHGCKNVRSFQPLLNHIAKNDVNMDVSDHNVDSDKSSNISFVHSTEIKEAIGSMKTSDLSNNNIDSADKKNVGESSVINITYRSYMQSEFDNSDSIKQSENNLEVVRSPCDIGNNDTNKDKLKNIHVPNCFDGAETQEKKSKDNSEPSLDDREEIAHSNSKSVEAIAKVASNDLSKEECERSVFSSPPLTSVALIRPAMRIGKVRNKSASLPLRYQILEDESDSAFDEKETYNSNNCDGSNDVWKNNIPAERDDVYDPKKLFAVCNGEQNNKDGKTKLIHNVEEMADTTPCNEQQTHTKINKKVNKQTYIKSKRSKSLSEQGSKCLFTKELENEHEAAKKGKRNSFPSLSNRSNQEVKTNLSLRKEQQQYQQEEEQHLLQSNKSESHRSESDANKAETLPSSNNNLELKRVSSAFVAKCTTPHKETNYRRRNSSVVIISNNSNHISELVKNAQKTESTKREEESNHLNGASNTTFITENKNFNTSKSNNDSNINDSNMNPLWHKCYEDMTRNHNNNNNTKSNNMTSFDNAMQKIKRASTDMLVRRQSCMLNTGNVNNATIHNNIIHNSSTNIPTDVNSKRRQPSVMENVEVCDTLPNAYAFSLYENTNSNDHACNEEWLRVPELFHYFANIIEYQELQRLRGQLRHNRRERFRLEQQEQQQWQEEHIGNSMNVKNSYRPVYQTWEEERQEVELEHKLQEVAQSISFSVFEIKYILLNRLFTHWSNDKLRALVYNTTSCWNIEEAKPNTKNNRNNKNNNSYKNECNYKHIINGSEYSRPNTSNSANWANKVRSNSASHRPNSNYNNNNSNNKNNNSKGKGKWFPSWMQKLERQTEEVKRPSRNSSIAIRQSVNQHCAIETINDAVNNNNNNCIDNTHRTSSRNNSSRNTSNKEQNRLSFQQNNSISLTEEENNMSSFDKSCFILLDAISRDEPCTLHFTSLFRMWCKMLSASHHWPLTITYVMSGLFVLFLIILIALIGCHAGRLSNLTRSSQLALIILFTIFAFVLLMAMLHFTIALFTHNTYTDVVARFFRERTYNLASLQTQVSEHSLSIPSLEESVELSEEEEEHLYGAARESQSLLVSPKEEYEEKLLSEHKKIKDDSSNHKKSKKEHRHKKHKRNMSKEYEQNNSQRNYDYLQPDKLEEITEWKRKSAHANVNGDVDVDQDNECRLNKVSPTHTSQHNVQNKQLRIANGNKEEEEQQQENARHKKRLDKENVSADKQINEDDVKTKTKDTVKKHHHKLPEIPPSSSLPRKKENEEEISSHSSGNSQSISNYSNGSSYSYSYSHSHSHSSSSSSSSLTGSSSSSTSSSSSLLKGKPSRSSSLKRSKRPSLQKQESEVHNVEDVISGNTENKEKKIKNNNGNNDVVIPNNEKRRRSSSHHSAGRVNMDVPERPERRESNVFMQKPMKIPHPPMLPENNANANNKMLDKEQHIKLGTSTSAALPLAEFLTSSFQSHNKHGPLQDHERMDWDDERQNALLMSNINFSQHQYQLQQNQDKLLRSSICDFLNQRASLTSRLFHANKIKRENVNKMSDSDDKEHITEINTKTLLELAPHDHEGNATQCDNMNIKDRNVAINMDDAHMANTKWHNHVHELNKDETQSNSTTTTTTNSGNELNKAELDADPHVCFSLPHTNPLECEEEYFEGSNQNKKKNNNNSDLKRQNSSKEEDDEDNEDEEDAAEMAVRINIAGRRDSTAARHNLQAVQNKLHITALLYVNDIHIAAEVSLKLWANNFLVLKGDLKTLDEAYHNWSERYKVFLLHAPDLLPQNSPALQLALQWISERRPVFFFSSDVGAYAVQLPIASCMEFPLSDEDIGSLLLAGLGLEYLDSSMLALSPTPFKVPVYTLGKRLGGGAFGNVFEAEMEKTGAKCAVKRIYLRSSDSDEDNDEEESESENENECVNDKEVEAAAAITAANENNNLMEDNNALKAHKEGEEEVDTKKNEVSTNNNAEAASEENKLLRASSSNDKKHRTKVNGVTSQLREIAQEVEIMSSLCHPNIVRYMFCERDDNCISIFMELCSGGSLGHLLKQYQTYLTANSISNHSTANSHTHNSTSPKHTRLITSSAKSGHAIKAHDNMNTNNNNNNNNALYMMLDDPERIKKILTEIISAVNYLHTKRIVHRDLKPDNVLFSCEGHAKVSDFGTAVHKQNEALSNVKGTVAYMAPEILVGDKYGKACDIWSIGCIAAEVLSVQLPQHGLGLVEMVEFYKSMAEQTALEIHCTENDVKHFLESCLQRNPSSRHTASMLLEEKMLQLGNTSILRWMSVVKEQRKSVMTQRTKSQMSDTLMEMSMSSNISNNNNHHHSIHNNNNVNIDNDGILSLKSSLIRPVVDHMDSMCSLTSDNAKMASSGAHMKQMYTSHDNLSLISEDGQSSWSDN